MATPMNSMFNEGFSKVFSVLGIDRKGKPGAPMLERILRHKPEITATGGRSAGAVAALKGLKSLREPSDARVKNVVLISFPYGGAGHTGESDNLLKQLPRTVKNILIIQGDRDEYGGPLDGTWKWLDKTALPNRNVYKVLLRGASHGSSVLPKAGGDAARDAILRIAGQFAAAWLASETKSPEVTREGAIWYNFATKEAYWSGWRRSFNTATADEWGI